MEYTPNSHKSKETTTEPVREKKTEKVIKGSAKIKKKGEFKKFAEVFIAEDVQNVKSYIIMGVLIPTIKKAILDIITNGIDMLLYGESGRNRRGASASKISYQPYYDRPNVRTNYSEPKVKTGYSYDDVVLDTRGEAEDVLSRMDELVSVYGMVSVGDLYDMVDIIGVHTDNNYGWTDLKSASVERCKDGYLLKLPKITSIK